jgi:hypothetical protein
MHPSHSSAALNQRATEFRLHGPLTLIHDGMSIEVPLGGPRELLTLLLLERHRGRSRVDINAAHDALPARTARRRIARPWLEPIRETLNGLLDGTGLKVIKVRTGFVLEGADCRSDLDGLITGLRSAETASSLAEVFEIVDRAVDLGPGAPLEGLDGAYFLPLHLGFSRAWRAAAIGWVWAASAVELSSPGTRYRVLFSGKARGLEASMPVLKKTIHELLKTRAQSDVLPAVQAVLRGVVDDSERHVSEASAEAIRGARRAGSRNRTPRTLAPVQRQLSIEVSVYLGEGGGHGEVESALTQLLAEVDMETYDHEPPVVGSWYRRFWARTRVGTAHLSAEQIAAEVERKIRIEVFDKAQASIDNQQATGAAALIAALQGETHACIRVGSLLVLKVDGRILVNTLTQYQLAWLERNQMLLRDPAGLLSELEKLAENPAEAREGELPAADMASIEMDSTKF